MTVLRPLLPPSFAGADETSVSPALAAMSTGRESIALALDRQREEVIELTAA